MTPDADAPHNEGARVTVFDIDGVLADVTHRLHYLRAQPKDWRGFFGAAHRDPPLTAGFALLAERIEVGPVVYLTGRPERMRALTDQWLRHHGAPDAPLLMRPGRDFRPAVSYKLEKLRSLGGTAAVSLLVDDDETVCDGAEAAGYVVHRAAWAPHSRALHDAQEREGRT